MADGPRRKAGCQRYVFVAMGALAIFNAYAMRSAFSVAITVMAEAAGSSGGNSSTCPNPNANSSSSALLPPKKAEFDWDEALQGQVLSALFYGYVAMNVPSGLLADRFGGKRVLFGGLLLASVSTMMIPVAARYGGPGWVMLARVLEGVGESATYPGGNNMLAFWAPAQERSKMGSILFSGNLLGSVVGTALSGFIIEATDDWASAFYVFGSVGVLWCVAFWFLCFDTPSAHPRISPEELKYIETSIKNASTKRPKHIPWKSILLSLPVWGLIAGQLGHDWVLFTLGTELPKYMKSILHYNVAQNGFISSLPNLVTWITAFLSGFLSDWLITTGRMSIVVHRKLFTCLSCLLPAIGLLGATYAECDQVLVVALFCLGMACMGPFYSSLKVNGLDISPNFSGLVMSIVNGLGAVSGIVSPDIVGLLIPQSTLTQWRDVFWVTLGVCVVSSLIYLVLGSVELQPWNTMPEDEQREQREQRGSRASKSSRGSSSSRGAEGVSVKPDDRV